MLLLHMRAALSLTLTFEKLLLLHRHAALSLTLKLELLLLLLPHKHAALSLKAAPQVRVPATYGDTADDETDKNNDSALRLL